MTLKRVLIVEDDPFISLDVEQALVAAGFEVCGSAVNEQDALEIGRMTHPDFAVVDVNLSPGDGRRVARELCELYATTVLMATSECDGDPPLSGLGAAACLPKPYNADAVAASLEAAAALKAGEEPSTLPIGLIILY
jgi:DNA-binding response OmpR family regulator